MPVILASLFSVLFFASTNAQETGKYVAPVSTGFFPIIHVNNQYLRLLYKCHADSNETFIAGPYDLWFFNEEQYDILDSLLPLYAEVKKNCPDTVLDEHCSSTVQGDFRRTKYVSGDTLSTLVEGKKVTFKLVAYVYVYNYAKVEMTFSCVGVNLTAVVAPPFVIYPAESHFGYTMKPIDAGLYEAFKGDLKITCGLVVEPIDLKSINFVTFDKAYIELADFTRLLTAI
ncbi:hypothetical protein FOZ61_002326 [Perkinsus olseni]|uniref:Uncharacterized protein n=1 Tax=Perkinsus olseni TaxID=32597 RepID=A0A7J6KNM2_PEROL|nr:hypothetical protein FOZ61_002326 [Perkinsus olseni]KAF4649185.1 hypothetical protein FOL46_002048 [Perkinsus olseni]